MFTNGFPMVFPHSPMLELARLQVNNIIEESAANSGRQWVTVVIAIINTTVPRLLSGRFKHETYLGSIFYIHIYITLYNHETGIYPSEIHGNMMKHGGIIEHNQQFDIWACLKMEYTM